MTAKFPDGTVRRRTMAFQKRVEEAALFVLTALGEELVAYARDNRTYTDQTGNLTNSMGYAVARGSEIVNYGGQVQQGEGADAALETAMKMAETLPNSYSLVVVAGMNYAAYVEAKGYNVIVPAELKARRDFPQVMQRLVAKATEKAKEMFARA